MCPVPNRMYSARFPSHGRGSRHGPTALPAAMAADSPAPGAEPFVGIHIAPHSVLDEEIDYCLDLLHDKAAVNVLLLSPYCYYAQ